MGLQHRMILVLATICMMVSSSYGAQVCSPDVLAKRVGSTPTSLPSAPSINTARPWFAPLTCSQTTFYPQNGEGTYVVGFNVTDPCSGYNTGGTTTVTVTCANRLPAQNVTVDWVFAPLTPSVVRLTGTVSSCFNVAAGFWTVLSAPSGTYTPGQVLTQVSGFTGPSYYAVDFGMSALGPYALQFGVYDNCAVYYRNVTIVWDGTLAHVLPPQTQTSSCIGNLAPVKIANTPLKAAVWAGRTNQFRVTAITSSLLVRESSGSELVSYQWGLNVTDGQQVQSTLTTTTSSYQIGNFSTSSVTSNTSTFISSESSVGTTEYIVGSAPISGVHRAFKGSPLGGVYNGPISRPGFVVKERTIFTTVNSSFIVFNTTSGTTVTDQTCGVSLSWASTTNSQMNLVGGVSVPTTTPSTSHWPYITAAAKCAGTYMLSVKTVDAALCSSNDYDWFMMDCGPQPNAVLSPCNDAVINFQYSDRSYRYQGDATVLDARLSVDTMGRETICCYQFTGVPSASALYGQVTCGVCAWTVTNPAPTFDVAGDYEVTLWASNYCSASKVSHKYTIACEAQTVTASIAGTDPAAFANVGISSSGTVTLTATSPAEAAPTSATITQIWTFTSQPTIPLWVSTFLAGSTPSSLAGYFTSVTAIAPSVVSRFAGAYGVTATATVGCQQNGVATHTYTMSCANTLAASVVGGDRTVTDTCGTGWSLQTLVGAYTLTPATTTTNIVYHWTLSSAPSGSSLANIQFTGASVSFLPDVAGAYVWKLVAYDYCQLSPEVTVTVTAVSTPDPIAAITITTPSQSTYYSKDLIAIEANLDAGWSYSWNITVYPNGVIPTSGLAVITNANTRQATFYAVPGGIYWVTVTITTPCGATKSSSFQLNVLCPYPLTAVVSGHVSGSGNSTATSVTTWPEGGNWRQVTLTGVASSYGTRYVSNITADWVVTAAPIDSLWAPTTNTTWVTNTFDTMINSTWTKRQVYTRAIVTKQFSHLSSQSSGNVLGRLEACFQPDLPGTYTIEMRLTDGCQQSVATVTVMAACVAPPVAVITRRAGLPPNVGGSSEIARSTDGSLRSTVPPSDGARIFLDATSSYSTTPGTTLGYYWSWLSPATQAFSTQGIDPAYGPRVLLSPPYPANATLILYVTDGCTYSTARVALSCGSDVTPSLASMTVQANVDPYSRQAPEFVISTGLCYPYELTKWHLVSYAPTNRDFTMQAQAALISTSSESTSLSDEAKLGYGIGFGLVLPLILLAALGFYCYRKRAQSSPPVSQRNSEIAGTTSTAVPLQVGSRNNDLDYNPPAARTGSKSVAGGGVPPDPVELAPPTPVAPPSSSLAADDNAFAGDAAAADDTTAQYD